MKKSNDRRSFLKTIALGGTGAMITPGLLEAGTPAADATSTAVHTDRGSSLQRDKGSSLQPDNGSSPHPDNTPSPRRAYDSPYAGEHLNRVAFPVGGLGAGMFCLEGTGAISHMSIRHRPEIFHEPALFAAIAVKGRENGVKLLEGPVPEWKMFGQRGTGNGAAGTTYGLPRFRKAEFTTRFPFATIHLQDADIPLQTTIKGWSPFIPGDEDNSGLPVGALEYHFTNSSAHPLEAVFSFNTKNFLAADVGMLNRIASIDHGFVLIQKGDAKKPEAESAFAAFTDTPDTVVDHCWFRGGWWDPLTMAWNTVRDAKTRATPPAEKDAPGASLFVPFTLAPGASKTIRLMLAWYVPESNLHIGESAPSHYKPWYSSRFAGIEELAGYWKKNYEELRANSALFADAFYGSSLPPEVMEAVAANLTILKSPTVLRQYDGRLWAWEGCGDDGGCCHGSCTHVWNYAQALPHLFPALERTLRDTEFKEDQNEQGHQGFRASLPISPIKHDFHAASDGQLGGIMKVYREWRISGDEDWLKRKFPAVQSSMDYCIATWDPRGRGVVEEPHHNTYDIEFWGPDGMITSFYLGALTAMIQMGKHLDRDVARYEALYAKGKKILETHLFDGEYFIQDIEYKDLRAEDPAKALSFGGAYSTEAVEMLKKEGPKYQYGKGCLSDGILGAWIGAMCGLPAFVDGGKISSHLLAVHKYNLKTSLVEHANPQRPAYALGSEGGLLLCTWPKGGKLSLPFVYSDEVWTGIEYQVAAHLMQMGHVQQGLEVVRLCRNRYDGRIRNPFNEYECGHWYARAMSSYGLFQALTGLRYDAVQRTLYVDSQVGDFTCFLSTATGFGTVLFKAGKATTTVLHGRIDIDKTVIGPAMTFTGSPRSTSMAAPVIREREK